MAIPQSQAHGSNAKTVTALELLDRFCKKIQAETLPSSWNDDKAWTRVVHSIMRDIGEELGYVVRDKFTLGEFLGLDQVWRIQESGKVRTYLAMEVENTGRLTKIVGDEFQKLVDVKAEIKVLVYYPDIENQADHAHALQKTLEAGRYVVDETYVTVMLDSNASRTDSFRKYSKLVINAYQLIPAMEPIPITHAEFTVNQPA